MAESANNPVNPSPNPSKMPPGNDAGAARANPVVPPPPSVPAKLSAEESTKKLNEFTEAVKNQKKAFADMAKITEAMNKEQKKAEDAIKRKSDAENAYAELLKKKGDAGLSPEEIEDYSETMRLLQMEIDAATKAQEIHSKQLEKAKKSTNENYLALDAMFSFLNTSQLALNASQHRSWGDAKFVMKQWVENTQKDIAEQKMLAAQLEKKTNALKKIEEMETSIMDLRKENETEAFANVKSIREEEIKSIEEKIKEQAEKEGLKEEEIAELRVKLVRDASAREEATKRKLNEQDFNDRKKRAIELARYEQKLTKDKSIVEAKEALQQAKIVRAGDINAAMKEIEARELMRWQLTDEGVKRLAMAKTEEERQEILKKKSEEILRSEDTKKAILAEVQKKHQEEYQKKRLEEIQRIAKEEKVSISEATTKFEKSDEATKMSYESKKELEDISISMDKLYTINEQGQAPLLEAMESIDESSARSVEESVEGKYTKPMWAMSLEKVMEGGFADTVSGLASGFNSLKPPSGGWFKTLLLVGAFIVGGIVAYIVKLVSLIVSAIKGLFTMFKIPGLGFLEKIFGPLMKGLSKVGGFFGRIIGVLSKIFPFLGNIISAFKLGFGLVSKVFFPLQIIISTIDGIIGAFKGFKKDGIAGAVIGMIANIISGLTFGLLDFEWLMDAAKPLIDGLNWVFNTIGKVIGFVYDNIIAPAMDALSIAFTYIGHIFGQLMNVMGTIWNKIIKPAIVDTIGEIFSEIGEVFSSIYDNIISPVLDMFGEIFSAIGEVFSWIYDNIISPVIEGIQGFFGAIGDFFVGVDNFLYDKLGWLGYTKMSGGGGGGGEPAKNSGALASGEVTKAIETTKEITQSGTGSVSSVIMAAGGAGGGGGGVQPVIVSSANSSPILNQITAGNAVPSGALVTQTSSVTSERERLAAAATKPSVVVNAPKTIAAGGGGGEQNLIIPKFSRNNDPTYRALCFMEAPAM